MVKMGREHEEREGSVPRLRAVRRHCKPETHEDDEKKKGVEEAARVDSRAVKTSRAAAAICKEVEGSIRSHEGR
jgi:hypothetical protein